MKRMMRDERLAKEAAARVQATAYLLRHAAFLGTKKVATILSPPRNADPNIPDSSGWTPLHFAVLNNKVTAVRALLKSGADPDGPPSSKGWTPLHLATYHGHADSVLLLLDHGADTALRTIAGLTPEGLAVKWARPAMAKLLTDHNQPPGPILDSDEEDEVRQKEERNQERAEAAAEEAKATKETQRQEAKRNGQYAAGGGGNEDGEDEDEDDEAGKKKKNRRPLSRQEQQKLFELEERKAEEGGGSAVNNGGGGEEEVARLNKEEASKKKKKKDKKKKKQKKKNGSKTGGAADDEDEWRPRPEEIFDVRLRLFSGRSKANLDRHLDLSLTSAAAAEVIQDPFPEPRMVPFLGLDPSGPFRAVLLDGLSLCDPDSSFARRAADKAGLSPWASTLSVDHSPPSTADTSRAQTPWTPGGGGGGSRPVSSSATNTTPPLTAVSMAVHVVTKYLDVSPENSPREDDVGRFQRERQQERQRRRRGQRGGGGGKEGVAGSDWAGLFLNADGSGDAGVGANGGGGAEDKMGNLAKQELASPTPSKPRLLTRRESKSSPTSSFHLGPPGQSSPNGQPVARESTALPTTTNTVVAAKRISRRRSSLGSANAFVSLGGGGGGGHNRMRGSGSGQVKRSAPVKRHCLASTPNEVALRKAIEKRADSEKIRSLVQDLGCDVNVPDPLKSGETPLHAAAKRGLASVITALTEHGARVNVTTALGSLNETPLHYACQGGFTAAVKALLTAGADAEVTNFYGETARDLAFAQGHSAVLEVLPHPPVRLPSVASTSGSRKKEKPHRGVPPPPSTPLQISSSISPTGSRGAFAARVFPT